MLFTAFFKVRGDSSTINERSILRAQYSLPEDLSPVTEYWFHTTDPTLPHVAATFEADSPEPIFALLADWDAHFHITVVPTTTAEEGLKAIEQTMQTGQEQA